MIKVLLADDHQMFIEGLRAILEDATDIQIVGEAKNGEEVLEIMEDKMVDVVVLDIEMPILNGIDTMQVIRKEYPRTKVLMLTMHAKRMYIMKLLNQGANGYILKNRSKEELIMAIHKLYKGECHYPPDILRTISEISNTPDDEVHLTEREIQVLCLIAEGLTTNEIADKLFIATTTVNTHRRNLLGKINVRNDNLLVRYAVKYHYLLENWSHLFEK